jgi:hypothetical protein
MAGAPVDLVLRTWKHVVWLVSGYEAAEFLFRLSTDYRPGKVEVESLGERVVFTDSRRAIVR